MGLAAQGCFNTKGEEARMGKRPDTYQAVTDRIVQLIEAEQTLPWRQPWKSKLAAQYGGFVSGQPMNAVSLKPYRGSNIALAFAGYTDPRWLTFKQAKQLGGGVRKGERASIAVLWKFFGVEAEDSNGRATVKQIPMIRHYPVFNVEQCDGLERLRPLEVVDIPDVERLERCEATIQNMPQRPAYYTDSMRAFYRPHTDSVHMPHPASFDRVEDYYHTAFHELAHATGHESRLKREGIEAAQPFGSKSYAEEELVAELASAMVGRVLGIDPVLETSADYIKGWASRLKDDPKLFVRASGRAQKAAEEASQQHRRRT